MAFVRGGSKFQSKLNELTIKLVRTPKLRVGFLEGSTYPDGTSVPLIAAINEFGAPSRGQPPRPYFRNMIAAKKKEWAPAMAALMKANNYDTEKVLNLTGEAIKGQLVESIASLTSPPLKPSTIRRKGFSKPLIDTSAMIGSVGFEVK